MRKTIIFTILLIFGIIIILLFFPIKNNEREVNLGHGYYYIPFQEIVFDVTTFGGNGIYVYKNNQKIPIIYPEIKSYKYDTSYIIVKQVFDMETARLIQNMLFRPNIYFGYDKDLVFLDEKYTKGINVDMNSDLSMKKTIEIMYKDKNIKRMIENKVNYYMIDKHLNKTFGPFNIEEFEKMKSEMKIEIDF